LPEHAKAGVSPPNLKAGRKLPAFFVSQFIFYQERQSL
jgi:hypothetical protein